MLFDIVHVCWLQYRADHVVPQRMREMEAAITRRDFEAFGRLTMQVINSHSHTHMHARTRVHTHTHTHTHTLQIHS